MPVAGTCARSATKGIYLDKGVGLGVNKEGSRVSSDVTYPPEASATSPTPSQGSPLGGQFRYCSLATARWLLLVGSWLLTLVASSPYLCGAVRGEELVTTNSGRQACSA